ncbi:FliH/SctL family protein [Microbacterium sp. STN6]|uniref:FliH/SctL family protein n=1 Tax=Microbacterium sp. STN6 TaxID=2995588 RepID=UPI002260E574|nr:FliH/SctL family protein [Microbacterium sp. STN6]MCX7522381.1 FliH/SctL family protein [Microbacterium sp. STN6]
MSTDTRFSGLSFPALNDARRDDIEAQARVQGHAAGYAAGLKAAQRQLDERRAALEHEFNTARAAEQVRVAAAVAALTAARAALDSCLIPVLDDAQDSLAAAAVDIAEAILGRELADGADSARSALRRALDHAEADDVIAVRLNPADLADLRSLGDEATGALSIPLQADPALARGDAIAELPAGYLDARITSSLARVRAALGEGA